MRIKTVIRISAVILILALGLFAYTKRDSANKNHDSITAVGSTALQPLVEAAAEQYSSEHGGVFINVQGGGSGTGLSQIKTGAVDMGNSDEFAEEKSGLNAKHLVDHKIAVVGVAPIVNQDVGITNLSQQQLIEVFTGKVVNWSQLGGQKQKITLINRTQGSGTRSTFEKFALKGHKSAVAQEQDSSGTVRQIVATTPGAISYVAFGYVNKSVQPLAIDHIKPNYKNVTGNRWHAWSYEHIYTLNKPRGLTKVFLNYLSNRQVQKEFFHKLGYISVADMQFKRDWRGRVTPLGGNHG